MAGAEVTVLFALVSQRHATQMRADADQDQPLLFELAVRSLHQPRIVGLWVAKFVDIDGFRRLDFFFRAMAHEDRLAAPLHRDFLSARKDRKSTRMNSSH